MSASLQGLEADVRAPEWLGLTKAHYCALIERIADQVALDDDEQTEHQRAADVDEAEWMLGVLYAAGVRIVVEPP